MPSPAQLSGARHSEAKLQTGTSSDVLCQERALVDLEAEAKQVGRFIDASCEGRARLNAVPFIHFGAGMSYKNKTYVIFDGDNDMWAYAYMKGWKSNENMDFNFLDAHDIRPLSDRASEDTVKNALRLRFSNAKQVVVLVGENTRNLYKFVRWEIEVAQKRNLPIIVANLNGIRKMDPNLCPALLRNWPAVHVAFKAKIIQHALDDFPGQYDRIQASASTPHDYYYYNDQIYAGLGL
jgi:MTH538 TIR-like domain (DUF1863)